MGKRHHLVLTVAAALVLTPTAVARTSLDATVKVTPSKAGTTRRPAAVQLQVTAKLSEPSVITGVEVWNGPDLAFDRGRSPSCSLGVLQRRGSSGCPPGSIVGRGSLYGPDSDFDRPSGGGGKLVFVNGGRGRLLADARITYPARVRAVLDDAVVDGARGLWPHRDAWAFPPALQGVAGTPILLDDLSFFFGLTRAAKHYVASTACPKGGWAWKVRVRTRSATGAEAVLDANGRAPCTAAR